MKRVVLPLLLLVISCGKESIRPMATADNEFARGEAYFRKGDYGHAIKSFEYLIFNFPGSRLVDDAQFHVAKAYLKWEKYEQANLEAQFLIENFPRSDLVEEAYIIRAKALFATLPSYRRDQSNTKEAIRVLEYFIENFPDSEFLEEARDILYKCRSKIAYKMLKSGSFYRRRNDLGAAVIYFNNIIDNYPETSSARAARFYFAEILQKQMKVDKAQKHYTILTDSLDEWGKKAQKALEEIEK